MHIGWQASVFRIRIHTWTQATTEANTLHAVRRGLLYVLLMKWWRGAAHDDWTKAIERKKQWKKKQEFGSQNSHMNALNVFCARQCYYYCYHLYLASVHNVYDTTSVTAVGGGNSSRSSIIIATWQRNHVSIETKWRETGKRWTKKKILCEADLCCFVHKHRQKIIMTAVMTDGNSDDHGSIYERSQSMRTVVIRRIKCKLISD